MWADGSCRRGDGRSSATRAGQTKGEPGRSSSRQEVSSRLGCLRKQAGLSHLPRPPLLPVPAAQPVPHEELSGPAAGLGSCPALYPQGTVAGAPQAEGVLPELGGTLPVCCRTAGVHV